MADTFVGFVGLGNTLNGAIQVVDGSGTPTDADAFPTFQVFGQAGPVIDSGTCGFKTSGTVTNASNASPIVITSSNHSLATGAYVTVQDVGGNTAANGDFVITKVDNNSFSLDGSTGNGSYTTGGTWHVTGWYSYDITVLGADGYDVGKWYPIQFVYELSSVVTGQIHTFIVS